MYVINTQHRDGNPEKAQWTISTNEEIQCFDFSNSMEWIGVDCGWGLHIQNNVADWLGVLIDRTRKSFIAKFVGSSNPTLWHGYPADHQNKNQDIPDPFILRSWKEKNFIRPAVMRKISRGQQCSL